ncbi:unnamed protein product [Caenorhabditis auriculariae]|uniref:Uncharacterized protein n=1 Tax=Caenorhabditis auriculariae TaxID=2777116 RepID=A0A8S1HCH5_9PELO|nr:unnamed protein product [Caenorhabditis auriculariae]
MNHVLGDLQIVVERHSDVLRNNALPFRVLIVLRALGFLLSYLPFTRVLLWLRPYQLFSIEVWRLITTAFCGNNVLELVWTVWSLHLGTNLARQNNTNEALLKLYAITQAVTTVSICAISYASYVFFGHTWLLYDEPVVGLVPVCAAVLVLIKQFLPDTIFFGTPLGRVKYTHLPFLAIVLSAVASFTRICNYVTSLQCLIGVQVAWTYLRFFNPNEMDAAVGDGSEHFTWASLFPSRTQPIFTVIGRVTFRSLVKFGVCRRQVRHVDLNSLQSVAVGINLPAIETSARDAERRRQKALRELNERLNKVRKTDATGYVNWDEDDVDTAKSQVEAAEQAENPSSPQPSSSRQEEETSDQRNVSNQQ